jgi:hypothetical protein
MQQQQQTVPMQTQQQGNNPQPQNQNVNQNQQPTSNNQPQQQQRQNNQHQQQNNKLQYVVERILIDIDESDNKTFLIKLLLSLIDSPKVNDYDYNVKGIIDTLNRTLLLMKRTECKRYRGTLKRQAFWTLTMTQALVATIMTKYSHKHWIKYKLANIMKSLPKNWLYLYNKPPPSTVYYLFNTNTKMDYVGESGDWRTRFFSEITEANKLSSLLKHNNHPKYQGDITARKQQQPYSIRVIQRQGIEHWITIPICDLTKHNREVDGKTIRKRYERHYINCLNPRMNTQGTNHSRYYRTTKTSKRTRPPIAIRKTRRICTQHKTPMNK